MRTQKTTEYVSILQATINRCVEEQGFSDAEADRARQWRALGKLAHAIAAQETAAYHAAEARMRLDRINGHF
jgi:hypothetical protein